MTFYAMVVVVAADSPDEALGLSPFGEADVEFVGDPWPVQPDGDEFDTMLALDQHPEIGA